MYFVPVVILLIVITADAIDSHAASDRRRRELLRIDDLANDERLSLSYVVDDLESQVAVFIVDPHLADVSFRDNVRLRVVFDAGDRHAMKVPQLEGIRDQSRRLLVT